MMIFVPFLVAFVIGIIILLVTWWFKKINLPLFGRIIPGVLTVIAAIILFYIGYVKIRGFEGAAYGFLSVFLICFAILSLIMAKKPSRAQ